MSRSFPRFCSIPLALGRLSPGRVAWPAASWGPQQCCAHKNTTGEATQGMREVNNANTTKTTLEAKHFRTLIAKTRTKNVFGFSNLLQTQLSKPLDILAVFFLKNRSQLQMELCYKKLLRNLVLHESKQQSTGNCSHLQKKK